MLGRNLLARGQVAPEGHCVARAQHKERSDAEGEYPRVRDEAENLRLGRMPSHRF